MRNERKPMPFALRTTRGLALVALVACSVLHEGQASAQAATSIRTPTPSPASPAAADRQAASSTSGSLALELGLGTLAVAGAWGLATVAYYTAQAECGGRANCVLDPAGAALRTFLVTAPLLTSIAIYITGDATGGDGSYLQTLLGAVLGTAGGLALGIAFATTVDGSENTTAATFGLAVVTAAPVLGALLAYRASCPSDPPRAAARTGIFHAAALPTLDGRGAMFSISGAM